MLEQFSAVDEAGSYSFQFTFSLKVYYRLLFTREKIFVAQKMDVTYLHVDAPTVGYQKPKKLANNNETALKVLENKKKLESIQEKVLSSKARHSCTPPFGSLLSYPVRQACRSAARSEPARKNERGALAGGAPRVKGGDSHV